MGFDFVRLRIDERADVGFLGEIAGAAIAVALGQRGGAGHGGVGEAIERVVSEGFVDVGRHRHGRRDRRDDRGYSSGHRSYTSWSRLRHRCGYSECGRR